MSKFKPVQSAPPPQGDKVLYKQMENPERELQNAWLTFLKGRGWHVVEMHASARFSGFPDLYITHVEYGCKLVEIKLPGMKGSRFTDAQWEKFPLLEKNGSPIWVLTAVCEDEYAKLFTHEKGNLAGYMLQKI